MLYTLGWYYPVVYLHCGGGKPSLQLTVLVWPEIGGSAGNGRGDTLCTALHYTTVHCL